MRMLDYQLIARWTLCCAGFGVLSARLQLDVQT